MFTKAIIIPTGDELASGVVLDTDSPAVMGELLRLEPTAFVARTSPVLDREEAISDTIKGFAAEGYDLIILLGGSGGGMEGILKAALEKNAGVRFVATVISLESMVRLTECIRELPVGEPDLVQLTAARARKAGRSHLMTGQNPVWIFSFEGTGNGKETDNE